jgi:hypothetical protein
MDFNRWQIRCGLAWSLITLGLVVVAALMSAGDLLASHCENGCDGDSAEPCQDCERCICCASNAQVLLNGVHSIEPPESLHGWTVHSTAIGRYQPLVYPIDHPPQNLS